MYSFTVFTRASTLASTLTLGVNRPLKFHRTKAIRLLEFLVVDPTGKKLLTLSPTDLPKVTVTEISRISPMPSGDFPAITARLTDHL